MAGQCNAEILSVSELLALNLKLPDYQRSYKWTRHNVTELLSDISMCLDPNDHKKYRVGTAILHIQDGHFNIVDGQQRILTFILIRLAIDPKFTCSILEDKRYQAVLAFDKTSQFNLHENFQLIKECFASSGEEYRRKMNEALKSSLEVVVITVEKEHEAFQLFDSQNTRGKRLNPHDLLKAYHLREMKNQYEMKHAVVKWEAEEPASIRELFNGYLYPIHRWLQREKCGAFTERQIDLYKGVSSSTEYSYGRRVIKAMPCYQLGEPFEAGSGFFGMVEHYLKMKKDVETEVFSNPSFAKIARALKDGDDGSVGFSYAKQLFHSALMCYYDRFYNFDVRAVTKICLWALAIRLDMERLGFDTINKYAIGESGYTNQCAMFAQIKNARSHLDVANISISRVQNEDRKPLSDALADL